MTRRFSFLIALPVLTACYVHPAPVDGSRDGGMADAHPSDAAPDDASAEDASAEDAQTAARDAQPDAQAACATDADCEVAPCESAACVEGECVVAAVADGTACDDGDLCTDADVCTAGECAGDERACSACRDPGGAGATLTTLPALWARTPQAMLARADGGITLTGLSDGNLWVAAVSASGEVTFDHGYGDGPMGDWGFALARPIGATADASALVAGYSQLDGGHARPWLIEVDADGDLLESHVPFGERGGSVHGLVPLPGGATIVLAMVGGHATLARLSAAMEIEWEHSYFDVGWAYGLAGVVMLPDGDLVIAGDVGRYPSRTVHVVRVRPTGEVVWERSLTAEGAGGILAQPDGKIVVVGQRYAPAGTGAAWLVRLDAAGNVAAERQYGAHANSSISSVAQAPDGTLVLAAGDEDDAWVLRTDATGVVLEEARLSLGAYERAESVLVLADGTVVVAGTSVLPGAETPAPRHAWVARAASLTALDCTD